MVLIRRAPQHPLLISGILDGADFLRDLSITVGDIISFPEICGCEVLKPRADDRLAALMVVGSRRIQQDLSRLLKRPEDRFIRFRIRVFQPEVSRAVVGRVDHRADIVENLRHLRIILSDGSGIHAASDDRAEHIRRDEKSLGREIFI